MSRQRIGRFVTANRRQQLWAKLGAAILVSGAGRVIPHLSGRTLHRAERAWAGATRRALGIRLELEGREHIRPDTAYVVASLHEGFADALVLLALGLDIRFIARDELFDWPNLGRYLRQTNQILVPTRADLSATRLLYRQAHAAIAAGESLVVFPQGSLLGLEIAFTDGAFRLARRLGVPLLPVVITGTHRIWEHPFSGRLRFGRRVTARVLAPVPPEEALRRRGDIERRMKQMATAPGMAPVRHYLPAQDGYWDGYRFEIDPDFPELAADVAAHRRAVAAGTDSESLPEL